MFLRAYTSTPRSRSSALRALARLIARPRSAPGGALRALRAVVAGAAKGPSGASSAPRSHSNIFCSAKSGSSKGSCGHRMGPRSGRQTPPVGVVDEMDHTPEYRILRARASDVKDPRVLEILREDLPNARQGGLFQ